MKINYEETTEDLQTRIDIHGQFGTRDIDAWMLEILNLEQAISILDVGCGSGKQCVAFYEHLEGDVKVTGGDVSAELLEKARAATVDYRDQIEIIELDFNKRFPFDDDLFDLVSCCFAIYYAQDVPFTIREMRRVIKPGGRLFTTGPMPENKKLFYDIIHEATGKPIPPMPGSSRFKSEFLAEIEGQFSNVDLHVFENPLVFPEVKPFMDYTRASLSEDRKLWSDFFQSEGDFERIMAQIEEVASRRFTEESQLVMTKVVGGIIAVK